MWSRGGHNGCRVLSYCWVRKIAKLEFENFVLLLHAELLLKLREPIKAFETRGSFWNTRQNSRRLFKSFFTAKAAQPYWIHCSLSGTTVIWILVSCPAPCPPPYATRSAKTRVTCRQSQLYNPNLPAALIRNFIHLSVNLHRNVTWDLFSSRKDFIHSVLFCEKDPLFTSLDVQFIAITNY